MRIDHIAMPYAFTSTGERILVKEITGGTVRVGISIEAVEDGYRVIGNLTDTDCVGGACPIR